MSKTWSLVRISGLVGALVVTVACGDSQPPVGPSPSIAASVATEVLDRAIRDEYLAETIYQGVIDDFGPLVPFTNVLSAEMRHSASIARLYVQRGLVAPANPYAVSGVPHYQSVSAACSAGVEAERANVEMYDGLLAGALPLDVRQVFTNNRTASTANHLPAFERCR